MTLARVKSIIKFTRGTHPESHKGDGMNTSDLKDEVRGELARLCSINKFGYKYIATRTNYSLDTIRHFMSDGRGSDELLSRLLQFIADEEGGRNG